MTRHLSRVVTGALTILVLAASLVVAATLGLGGEGRRLALGAVLLAAAAASMLAGVARGSQALRRAAMGAVVAGLALLLVWQLVDPDRVSSPWQPVHVPLVLAGAVAAAWGLAVPRPWARWLLLAAGWTGVLGFSWMAAVQGAVSLSAQPWWQRAVVLVGGSLLLVLGMQGAEMRARFATAPTGRRGALIAAAAILSLASAPYLVMIALLHHGSGSSVAWLTAALVVAGAVLVACQRTAGLLVAAAGAAGIVALAGVEPAVVRAWWGPLALGVAGAALGAGAVAGPGWRWLSRVRDDDEGPRTA